MKSSQKEIKKNFLKNIPEHLSILKKVIVKLEKIFFIYYVDEKHLYIYDLTKAEKKWLKEQKFLEDNNLAIKLKNHYVSYITIENQYLRIPRTNNEGFEIVSEKYMTIHTIKNNFIDFENNKIKQEFFPQKNWINFYNPYNIVYCSNYSKKRYPLQLKTILTLTNAQKIFFKEYFKVLSETNFFIKDILRDFEEDKYSINVPIDFPMLELAKNKKHLLEIKTKSKLTPVYNKISLNHAYSVFKAKKWVENNEINKLLTTDSLAHNIKGLTEKYRIQEFFISYFWETLKYKKDYYGNDVEFWDFRFIASDYINFKINAKEKINLKTKSFQRLLELHDEVIPKKEITSKRLIIKETNPFLKLKLPSKFIRIESTEQLYEEGQLNKNCVYSYLDLINQEKCIIYTTNWRRKKYTIEITMEDKIFQLKQISGYCNSVAPQDLKDRINKLLDNQNPKKQNIA